MKPNAHSTREATSQVALLALLLVLVLIGLARWRFLGTQLERDEGEFAYGAQRILAGDVPYVSFHAMKLPGIYLAYALLLVCCGETAWGIHLGLLLVTLASTTFVYALASRRYGRSSGLSAAAAFGLLTLSPAVQGTQAQSEHFVIFWGLAGACLLGSQRLSLLFFAGLMFGMSLLTKQHGLLFGIAAIACCWRSWRAVTVVALGWMLPLATTCATMAVLGAWDEFVFWTWTYPSHYATRVPPRLGLTVLLNIIPEALGWCWPLWILGALGIIRAWRQLLIWALVSFLAICPGLVFRGHYFLLLMPVVAVGVGVSVRWLRAAPTGIAIAWTAASLAMFYAPLTPPELISKLYYDQFFNEAPEIGRFLAEQTQPSEPIGVLASEPQLLFNARRVSVSPHIYMYPLMENQPYALKMQDELIAGIEQGAPKILVVWEEPVSWLYQPGAPTRILDWVNPYLAEHYYQVGRVECSLDGPPRFAWDEAALAKPPEYARVMNIYRRKSGH